MTNELQLSDKTTSLFLNIGKLEGYSYLFLLIIAMPLKYIFKMPQFVQVTGYLHGILFITFIVLITMMLGQAKLSFKKAVFAFLLSLIPFGTFYLKRLVKK
jgi:integral membrane protein